MSIGLETEQLFKLRSVISFNRHGVIVGDHEEVNPKMEPCPPPHVPVSWVDHAPTSDAFFEKQLVRYVAWPKSNLWPNANICFNWWTNRLITYPFSSFWLTLSTFFHCCNTTGFIQDLGMILSLRISTMSSWWEIKFCRRNSWKTDINSRPSLVYK